MNSVDPAGRCSCGDPGCTTPGKHLRNLCATRSPERLRDWWRRWPGANVGLPTGPENGLLVLDVDSDQGGDASLDRLSRRYGPVDADLEALTGGGGRHLYFRYPPYPVPSRNGWREGIDIRGAGGYVVAPPSRHASGRLYRWRRGPGAGGPGDAPEWLLALLRGEVPIP